MEHLSRWERIAVVTDVEWIRFTIRALNFVIPGETKVFRLDETPNATAWIAEHLSQ